MFSVNICKVGGGTNFKGESGTKALVLASIFKGSWGGKHLLWEASALSRGVPVLICTLIERKRRRGRQNKNYRAINLPIVI